MNNMTQPVHHQHKWLLCALLAAAVFLAFLPALQCEFTYYDDPDYVVLNKDVQEGFTWHSIKWAFTTGHAANWHPLTWFSHILDCRIYGLKPAGHHFTNIVLHTGNAVLLFLLLLRMTGAKWASLWVAAIFGLHPLRAESVVWVAERKDVLSTLFWMLTALAYVLYAEARQQGDGKAVKFYILSLVAFALGLMSKPMLVTLPFVFLLLDYWPLRRLEFGGKSISWGLVIEKIPYLALAAADSIATFLVQKSYGVVASLHKISWPERLANTPVSYVRYLGKMFWPTDLAVYYGPHNWSAFQISGSVILLLVITEFALAKWNSQPWVLTGWLWYLGMLVPAIGLVHVGNHSIADRYTYMPSVGVTIIIAWTVRNWISTRTALRAVAWAVGSASIIACIAVTEHQIQFWRTGVSLFARAADVSDQDAATCYKIGCLAMNEENYPRAERCFERALTVVDEATTKTLQAQIRNNLGRSQLMQGRIDEAVTNFETAMKLEQRFPQPYYNMGCAFLSNGQPDVAVESLRAALTLDQNAAIYKALSEAYTRLGDRANAAAASAQAQKLAAPKPAPPAKK